MIALQERFDISRYLGKWYEVYRSKNISFEGEKVIDNYSLVEPNKIRVDFSQEKNGKPETGIGSARIDPQNPAKWYQKFELNWFIKLFTFDYSVLATDYDNYAIVYSRNRFFFFFTREWIWVMSRNQELNPKLTEQCFEIIRQRTGFKKEDFHKTQH